MKRVRCYRTQKEMTAELRALYGDASNPDSPWSRLLSLRANYLELLRQKPPRNHRWWKEFGDEYAVSYPFLSGVTQEYAEAQCRVMIVGRETNGWSESGEPHDRAPKISKVVPFRDATHAMEVCARFLAKGYSSHFWRAAWELSARLNPDQPASKARVAWSNVFRLDEDCRKPSRPLEALLLADPVLTTLLKREIGILEPDVIWFAAGPEGEGALLVQLPELDPIGPFPFTQIPNTDLAPNVFRSFHPRGLAYRNILESTLHEIKEPHMAVSLSN